MKQLREKYQPLAIGNIQQVSMEEWAEHWRPHGPGWRNPVPENETYSNRFYGGSDMAAILDCSPWKTKLQLFHQKVGVEPAFKRNMNADSKELGHIYETATALKYHYAKRKSGVKNLKLFVEGYVLNPDGSWACDSQGNRIQNPISVYMYRDGRKKPDGSFLYPWASANCDAFLIENGVYGILEIKTTSSRNVETIKKWQEGIVPEYYFWQCVYYMFVTNVQFCDICCSWGQSLDDMAIVRIHRDYEVEDRLIAAIEEFDEYVEQGIEPDTSTENGINLLSYYYELYGTVEKKKDMEYPELPSKYASSVTSIINIDKTIDELEEKISQLEKERANHFACFYPLLVESGYGQVRLNENEVAGITVSTPKKRPKMDLNKFKAEHPDLFDQFQTFDCVAFGKSSKENEQLKKKYMLPAEPNTEGNSLPTVKIKVLNRPSA